MSHSLSCTQRSKRPFFTRFIAPLLTFVASIGCIAHTPHDTIDALALGAPANSEPVIFVVRAGRHLMRSYDGGASWKELVNGIDARYSMTSLALAPGPNTAETVYLATDGDGVYVSHDAGASWTKANKGLSSLRIRHLAAAPDNENTGLIFAAATTGGLSRKSAGADWQRVLEDGSKITAIAFDSSQDGLRILTGDDSGNLMASTDRGNSWQKLAAIPAAGAINDIELRETQGAGPLIFLATEKMSVLRSKDGGSSFTKPGDWGFDKQVISVAVSPEFEDDTTIYASTWREAILKSEDGGQSWKKYESGLSTNGQADQPAFYSPHFRQIGIAEFQDVMYLAGFDGLFKSADGGRHWDQIETEPVGNIWALSLSPAVGNDFLASVTTFDAGAYLTRDSDLDWSVSNHGLISTRLRKLVFSPNFADDHTVFSSEDEGDYLLRSTSAGNRWNTVHLRPGWYVYWKRKILGALRHRGVPASLTTDLLTKEEKIRANPKGLAVSPDFKADQYLYVATRYRGNFESTDGGRTLRFAEQSPFKIWNLAMSPNFTADKTFFASSREQGIYKSLDAGESWRSINEGLDFLRDWEKQAAKDNDYLARELGRSKYYDLLLAVSPAFQKDETVFAVGGAGVFKSTDGGKLWKQKGRRSLPGHYVFAITLSPNYEADQTLIVSLKGHGLFKSMDGGETFSSLGRQLIESNHDIRHIEFSPLYLADNTLYAVSLEDLFRSTDGGDSWRLIDRPIRYESDKYDVISYDGGWEKIRKPGFSARWAVRSTAVNSSVAFSFVGTGVKWIGAKAPDLGEAEVYLDGKRVAVANQNSQEPATATTTFAIKGLPYKPHQLMIKAMAMPNGILIDAFDVLGNRPANN